MANTIPQNRQELFHKWHKRIRETQFGHYEEAKILDKNHKYLGCAAFVSAAIVGSVLFITLNKEGSAELKVALGLVSIASSVLSSFQTFFKYSENAEKNRAIAAKAGGIRREIEQRTSDGKLNDLTSESIDKLREAIDKIAEGAPSISSRARERALKQLD